MFGGFKTLCSFAAQSEKYNMLGRGNPEKRVLFFEIM